MYLHAELYNCSGWKSIGLGGKEENGDQGRDRNEG